MAAIFRRLERRRAAPVGNIHVGAGIDQSAQGLGVVPAAIAEHDQFDQRSPLQIVDVIERRPGGNQRSHDFGVAEMGRRDEGVRPGRCRRAVARRCYSLFPNQPIDSAGAIGGPNRHRAVTGNC